jgi:lambda family phage portal protein
VISQAIDSLIGIFSPKNHLDRLAAREAIARVKQRSQYAAAKTTLGTGGWSPVDEKINTLLANSNATLRARARQLVRDMPAMATAIRRLTEFTVGSGITLQARVKDPSTGKLAKGINQKIEDAWRYWCDEADDAGRLHFNEIQQLACRQECELGEYVVVKKQSKANGRYIPFSLMLFEPDSLATFVPDPLPGNEIHQGVEYDPRTGTVLAYHFEDSTRWNKTIRIPVNQVIMGFETLRPGQLRGVTPLAPVVLLAHSLRDYLEAEISSAQRAARWLAFVTSQDPAATMSAFGAAQSPTYSDTAGNSKYTMEFGNAIVDFLQTGEQVTIANHNRPGDSFYPFVEYIHQTFAAATGTTYELISGNYTNAKYTAARIARNDMLKGLGVRQSRIIRQLCDNVRKEFMDWAVITGRLQLPGYFADPAPYLRCVWQGDGMESLDPLREGRAESDAVANKLRSPQEILSARGRDPEQVLDEMAEWQEMLEARELTEMQKMENSGLQTNPAQVGGPEGDTNE